MNTPKATRRRGQGARATERLGDDPLDRNMVIRCSEGLYDAARDEAARRKVTLSDYVRSLILRDLS